MALAKGRGRLQTAPNAVFQRHLPLANPSGAEKLPPALAQAAHDRRASAERRAGRPTGAGAHLDLCAAGQYSARTPRPLLVRLKERRRYSRGGGALAGQLVPMVQSSAMRCAGCPPCLGLEASAARPPMIGALSARSRNVRKNAQHPRAAAPLGASAAGQGATPQPSSTPPIAAPALPCLRAFGGLPAPLAARPVQPPRSAGPPAFGPHLRRGAARATPRDEPAQDTARYAARHTCPPQSRTVPMQQDTRHTFAPQQRTTAVSIFIFRRTRSARSPKTKRPRRVRAGAQAFPSMEAGRHDIIPQQPRARPHYPKVANAMYSALLSCATSHRHAPQSVRASPPTGTSAHPALTGPHASNVSVLTVRHAKNTRTARREP
jgi:hypothetical protein